LNAYPVECDGPHRFTRFAVPRGDWQQIRREMEERLRVPVQMFEGAAWVVGDRDGGEPVDVECHEYPQLHQFILRNGLRSQAEAKGFETWFGFGGELSCVPRTTFVPIGPVLVEPVLRSRFAHEGVLGDLVVLVIRWQVRWRFAGDLTNAQIARWAAGENAVRIEGDGPRRGRIADVVGRTVQLLLRGGDRRELPADNYALVARPPIVQRYLRTTVPEDAADLYRQIQVASGTLERSGRRNRYQVKEREQRALSLLLEIGTDLVLPDGRNAHIADIPVEIRV
jgi:hypothetical protein